ncbi:MAG: LEA type 2 family protein [Paludibacterium sp.]|uniref:LEA type 2 family protein n=1 Tax=Paludibacterium sp. TaxID=1917523 RepID=UPI0025F2920D|nr:LEA type 2 family protein [Paludibacterium sp.]MBV8047933.1 LEA type 2 family protein [Paludibacterium sp.]
MKNTLRRLALLAALSLLAACGSLNLKKPEVQVADIQAGHSTLLQQDFTVTLRVQNPNDRELSARGLAFELKSHGKTLATGLSNQAISIPAMGEGTVPLTVHASLLDLIQLAQNALEQGDGTLDYQISGYLDGVEGWGRIPFKREGNLKVPH